MYNKNIVKGIIEKSYMTRENGDAHGAIEELLAALDRFPEASDLEMALSGHYIKLKKYSDAVRCLRSAISKEPSHEVLSRSLFWSLWQSGEINEAYKELDRFFEISGIYTEEYEVTMLSAMRQISEEEWDERMNAAEQRRKDRKSES